MRRLAFIRRARELGFSLDEVRALLDLVDERGRSCAEARDVALHHLADVRAKVADLKVMERVLKEMVAQCADGTLPDCPLLEALFRGPPEARILARGRESRRAGSQAFSTAPPQAPFTAKNQPRPRPFGTSAIKPSQPVQHESFATSFAKVWATSLNPSTGVT